MFSACEPSQRPEGSPHDQGQESSSSEARSEAWFTAYRYQLELDSKQSKVSIIVPTNID